VSLLLQKKYRSQGIDIKLAGSPVVTRVLKSQMSSDMKRFNRITLLIIVVFLFVMFRRISAVVYPVIIVALSLLATIGLHKTNCSKER